MDLACGHTLADVTDVGNSSTLWAPLFSRQGDPVLHRGG